MANSSAEKIAALEKMVADMMASMQQLARQNPELLQRAPPPSEGNPPTVPPAVGPEDQEVNGERPVPLNGHDNGGRVDDPLLRHPIVEEVQTSHAVPSRTEVVGDKPEIIPAWDE